MFIKRLYEQMKAAEVITAEIKKEMLESPEDKEMEKAFVSAYIRWKDAEDRLVQIIAIITNETERMAKTFLYSKEFIQLMENMKDE